MTPLLDARQRKLAYIAWVTVCVVWGTTYLAIRVALETVPVSLVAGIRWTAGGLLLACVLPFIKQPLPPLRLWGAMAVIGFLTNVIGNGMVVWAQQYVASGQAAVVVATAPFWMVFLEAWLPRGERLRLRSVGGLIVGFLGIVILVWPQLTSGGRDGRSFVIGVMALQLACIGWSLGTAYSRRRSHGTHIVSSAALQMLFGGFMLIALATVSGDWGRLSFTPRSAMALAYLAIFGSLIAYSAYLYAVKHLPVSTVSLYAYVNPIIAVVLGTIVLSEPFSLRILFAGALVFTGIMVVRSQPPAKVVEPTTRTDRR